MVVGNLPFTIFIDINIGVSSLDLVPSGSHCEFINTDILAPVVSNGDITFKNFSLWLFLQKVNKVVLDTVIVSAWFVGYSWKKNSLLGVSLGDGIRVKSIKSIIP